MYRLILASQSPRRRDILNEAGFVFTCDTVKVSEIIDKNLKLDDALKKLARDKAEAYVAQHNLLKGQKILVLSADTMVIYHDRALGKPENFSQAQDFLRLLSGKIHQVKTALCIWDLDTGRVVQDLDTTEVEFRALTENEIERYVKSGEPMDKAGAYALQGEGGQFVKRLTGSRTNVVGLPLELLEKMIRENGWHLSRRSIANS